MCTVKPTNVTATKLYTDETVLLFMQNQLYLGCTETKDFSQGIFIHKNISLKILCMRLVILGVPFSEKSFYKKITKTPLPSGLFALILLKINSTMGR